MDLENREEPDYEERDEWWREKADLDYEYYLELKERYNGWLELHRELEF